MDFLHHPETAYIVAAALREDIGSGDHTSLSTIPADTQGRARCIIKEDGVLAGMAVARKVFEVLDSSLRMDEHLHDGAEVRKGDIAFHVEGSARSILMAERTVLNIMQRMSGIATMTRSLACELEGTGCKLLDTRKTTPLVRHLEKWAVKIGGGENHRIGLYDMVMIKDNHHDIAGGIPQAIRAAQAYLQENNLPLKIEVETRNLAEVQQALDTGGIDRIMLDNMSPALMREAVTLIAGRTETEASGGITRETLREVALTGVDFISMGALTHSYKSLDISLKAMIG